MTHFLPQRNLRKASRAPQLPGSRRGRRGSEHNTFIKRGKALGTHRYLGVYPVEESS
jgi:hypothetical protein